MTDPEVLHQNTIRAQYVAATVDGEKVKGYREEEGVDSDSQDRNLRRPQIFCGQLALGRMCRSTCVPPSGCLPR